MNDPLSLAPALGTGVVLGSFFFGGLWWTVREGLSAKRAALWFLGSLVLRMSVTMVGFYVISERHWERLLACLLGFILARRVARWLTRPAQEHHSLQALEGSHAP